MFPRLSQTQSTTVDKVVTKLQLYLIWPPYWRKPIALIFKELIKPDSASAMTSDSQIPEIKCSAQSRLYIDHCLNMYIYLPEIEYYQKVSSHAQIRQQGAFKQLRKVKVLGCWVVV